MPKTYRPQPKQNTAIVIIIGCIAVIFAIKTYADYQRKQAVQNMSALRSKGNPSAQVRIVEYIDFECPACAVGANFLNSFMKQHADGLYLEMKYFPLKMHQHAHLAAQYAECAGRQEKFWPFHDLLIDRQGQWKLMADAQPAFEVMAKEVGLNMGAIDTCLKDNSVLEAIKKDKEEGTARGVKSTPTYFINGQMAVGTHSLQEALAGQFSSRP